MTQPSSTERVRVTSSRAAAVVEVERRIGRDHPILGLASTRQAISEFLDGARDSVFVFNFNRDEPTGEAVSTVSIFEVELP